MASQAPFNPFAFNPFQTMMQAYFTGLDAMAQTGQTAARDSTASQSTPSVPGFAQGMSQGFGAVPAFNPMQAMEPMMKGMARCQLEYMGFAAKRAQAYIEIPSRLALVRSPQDLMNEQMRFWQTATQQYQDSSRRIMAAATSMVPQQGLAGGNPNAKPKRRDYMSVGDPAESAPATSATRGRNGAGSGSPSHNAPLRVA